MAEVGSMDGHHLDCNSQCSHLYLYIRRMCPSRGKLEAKCAARMLGRTNAVVVCLLRVRLVLYPFFLLFKREQVANLLELRFTVQ